MEMKSLCTLSLLIATTLLVAWCSQEQKNEPTIPPTIPVADSNESKALKIVTTFPPLYAHVANIADSNDVITNLVSPGTSVHTRQPKPSDILAMENADIIVTNGLWLEEFLAWYLDTLTKKWVLIVDTSVWVDTITYEEEDEHKEDEHKEDEHEEDEHHHHEWSDPHIWLDPNNAQIQVEHILTSLSQLDPNQKRVYTEQASAYTDELIELDMTIKERLNEQRTQPFIVFHDAYQYFLQAYGLESMQIGLVQEFHWDSPSQKQLAELMKTIADNWVKTIYTEPQFNPSIVQRLEEETDVTSTEIDPIGLELSKRGYIDMLLTLAEAFVQQ